MAAYSPEDAAPSSHDQRSSGLGECVPIRVDDTGP
jgi:hypothetical protein